MCDYLNLMKLKKLKIIPVDILLVGAVGSGKSSTLNTICGAYKFETSDGFDCKTMVIEGIQVNDYIRMWDSPGFGNGIQNDYVNSLKITEALSQKVEVNNNTVDVFDIVILVINSNIRDFNSVFYILDNILKILDV